MRFELRDHGLSDDGEYMQVLVGLKHMALDVWVEDSSFGRKITLCVEGTMPESVTLNGHEVLGLHEQILDLEAEICELREHG